MFRISLTFLCVFMSASALFGGFSDDVENVINSEDPALRTQLHDHIKFLAMQRPISEPSPTTVEEWEKRRLEIRERLLDSLGLSPLPPRTPLNPVVMGTVDRPEYIIEKVVFESRPGFYVTSNLYIPKDLKIPAPAVLYVHGHGQAGKASYVQNTNISLARKGFIVLSKDGVGFGERWREGHRCQPAPYISGMSILGLEIWDNMRAIDYLLTRPEVDKTRIGITGSSGGGLQSTYMVALEDRLNCAVPVDFVTTFRAFIGTGRVHCICNHVPNVMRYADCADLLSIFAPKPLLIGGGEFDHIFPADGTRQTYQKVREIYRLYDAEDRLHVNIPLENHGYVKSKREATYAWFNKWFENDAEDEEASFRRESVEILHCFEDGKIPEPHETVATLNYKKLMRLRPNREIANRDSGELKTIIRDELFGGFPPNCDIEPKQRGRAEDDDIYVERFLYTSERHMTIPGLYMVRPDVKGDVPTVIYIDPDGKAEAAKSPEVQRFIELGLAVVIPDLRGYGEMYDPRAHYRGEREYLAVTNSVFLGRHLLGMRVYDVIRCADYISVRSRVDPENIGVFGKGVGGLIALFAGVLDERFTWAGTSGMLASYIPDPSWFDGKVPWGYQWEEYGNLPAVVFIPNIMKYADIPDIAKLFERPLMIENPVDGLLDKLNSAQAEHVFRNLFEEYDAQGKSEHLLITTENEEDSVNQWLANKK